MMISMPIRQDIVRLIGALLIMALIGTIFVPQPASAQAREAKPGDFFLQEFVGGLAGSSVGALAAAWGIERFSKPGSKGEEGATATEHEITVDIVGLGTGIAIGATVGVVVSGSLLGVNGNLLFAPLGGVLGVINAFGIIYWQEIEKGNKLGVVVRTIMVIAIPAFGAASFYNIGAKVRTKAGKARGEESERTKLGITEQLQTELTIPLLAFKVEF